MNKITIATPSKGTSSAIDFKQEFHQTIKHGNTFQICRAICREFFTNCSIHGFKHFWEPKRHWSERVFWVVMFVIATFMSCLMIGSSYLKWEQNPVIMSLSEKATPLWKLPFPAVTICPVVKTSETVNWNEMMDQVKALVQTCGPEIPVVGGNLIASDFTNASIIQTLEDLSSNLHEMMTSCKFGKYTDCSNLFKRILTEDGFCFTFNSLNSRDIFTDNEAPELFSVTGQPNAMNWNMEKGYNDSLDRKSSLKLYPNRAIGTGPSNGLNIKFRLDLKNVNFMCESPTTLGFKVILHSPAEIPQTMKNFFMVPIGQHIFVSVKPDMVGTTKELRLYEPNRKLCYLNSENPLKFFKVYTQRHCELECTSKFMEQECGCVYFAYPRYNSTPICDFAKFKCAAEIEAKMVELTFLDSLNNADSAQQNCNCLPSCTSINYNIEISSAKFDFNKYYNQQTRKHHDRTKFGLLHIYFKDKQFITTKRSELYGLIDFLAVCGGLLGLFIGVTALSCVEIFYYFTLRLAWTLQMYRFAKGA